LKYKFVEFIPNDLADDVLYISVNFGSAIHKCCCGCGREVVTPLAPTGWKLTFDGESVTLYPSIGNWSFPCRSHYWIRNGKIEWAEDWSDLKIKREKEKDELNTALYFKNKTLNKRKKSKMMKFINTLFKFR
jgi:hypothetical protein